MSPDCYIEALLFYKAGPIQKKAVRTALGIDQTTFTDSLSVLRTRLSEGALRLIETAEEIQLVTAPELSSFVETLRKEELSSDIGKAGAETLAIILYREPITRAEIDRIRGVNSSFIIRSLLVRGLIERTEHTKKNVTAYVITPALLAHLGVTHKHELPGYASVQNALEAFEIEVQNTTIS